MPSKINFKDYFKKAQQGKWAIGQFNFSEPIVLKAIVFASKKMCAPVILGASERVSKLLGLKEIVSLVRSFEKEIGWPLFLHLDHSKSFGYIKEAVDAGYDSVHFDGSGLALPENIDETKKVVAYARKFNVWVEGEIDALGGALTDPRQANSFIEATKIDSLAVDVGNRHGGTSAAPNADFNSDRLAEIKRNVRDFPLVLHGGSGIPDQDIEKAIKLGIIKININTELKETLNKFKTIEAVQKVVENKIKLFGSQNKI